MPEKKQHVEVDYDDLHKLSLRLTKSIEKAADIHGGFLHNYDVAVTLQDTAEKLQQAIENNYKPQIGIPTDVPASNDEIYAHHELEFQRVATGQVAAPNTLAQNDAQSDQPEVA